MNNHSQAGCKRNPFACVRPSIGGQAVMEGVMMNGKEHYAVSVRKTNGEIHTELFDHVSATENHKILALPIVRGVVRFVESLVVGMRTLNYSADFFMEEEEQASKKKEGTLGRWFQDHMDSIITGVSMVLAVVLCMGLFVALPVLVSKLVYEHLIHSVYLMGLVEGVVKMILFLLYLLLVSKIKDIARTFEYHGAEHKTINCFEAEEALTVENVKKHSRFNKRCGTSFLFIIMLVSILVFSFIQVSDPLLRFVSHLVLVPVIAGISYELLKFSAKSESKMINALVAPGVFIQHITTNEPDEQEIEVAIASVRKLLEAEHPEIEV